MTNDGIVTRRRRPIWPWLVGGGVVLGLVVMVAVLVGIYLVTAPDTPREAALDYIEDQYDALAEEVAYAVFSDSPLTAEIMAEVAESMAEQVIPYRCRAPEAGELTEVEARCTLSFEAEEPLAISIMAPLLVSVDLSVSDPFGRPIPEVSGVDFILTEAEVNGLSLQNMLQAGDILTQIGDAGEAIKEIRDAGGDVIKQVEDASHAIKQVGDAGGDAIQQIGDASDAIKQIANSDSDDGDAENQDDDAGSRIKNLLNR